MLLLPLLRWKLCCWVWNSHLRGRPSWSELTGVIKKVHITTGSSDWQQRPRTQGAPEWPPALRLPLEPSADAPRRCVWHLQRKLHCLMIKQMPSTAIRLRCALLLSYFLRPTSPKNMPEIAAPTRRAVPKIRGSRNDDATDCGCSTGCTCSMRIFRITSELLGAFHIRLMTPSKFSSCTEEN